MNRLTLAIFVIAAILVIMLPGTVLAEMRDVFPAPAPKINNVKVKDNEFTIIGKNLYPDGTPANQPCVAVQTTPQTLYCYAWVSTAKRWDNQRIVFDMPSDMPRAGKVVVIVYQESNGQTYP